MNAMTMIKATNVSHLRKNMKNQFDNVTNNDTTLIVTRNDNKNVVVLSESSYEEMIKRINNLDYTLKLMKSSKEAENRDFVNVSMEELETYE